MASLQSESRDTDRSGSGAHGSKRTVLKISQDRRSGPCSETKEKFETNAKEEHFEYRFELDQRVHAFQKFEYSRVDTSSRSPETIHESQDLEHFLE